MIRVKQAIIVEGRYDKIRLSNIVDTAIICTNGFSIYKDTDKQELIKSLAEKTGIIILTDSDSAGFQIRSFIRSIVKKGEVLNAVTPDIFGKERRKPQPSKQGKLGVEGIPDELIIEALKNCGAVIDGEAPEIWTTTSSLTTLPTTAKISPPPRSRSPRARSSSGNTVAESSTAWTPTSVSTSSPLWSGIPSRAARTWYSRNLRNSSRYSLRRSWRNPRRLEI